MLYTLKSAGKKYAYDSASGALIQLNALQFKMLGAILPPLTAVCPTSLRYELAKFDSMDVEEAYEYIYSLSCDGLIYGEDNGSVKIKTEGENACTDLSLAGELIALAFADAPSEFSFEIVGNAMSEDIKAIANGEAVKLGKKII
ncbi:MAG: hypothetical protein IJW79_05000 [Clostridia bacterium]|nr:hypothetical protein [Clostridia bacterium]